MSEIRLRSGLPKNTDRDAREHPINKMFVFRRARI
jgi:hypothetical protein